MKKIPTVFVRDPDDRKHVLPQVTPGCEWVLAGEGRATRKFDRLNRSGSSAPSRPAMTVSAPDAGSRSPPTRTGWRL